MNSVLEMCSASTGVGKAIIHAILKEQKDCDIKELACVSEIKMQQLSEDQKIYLKWKIRVYLNREIPTLYKILSAVKQDVNVPKFSQFRLHRTLQELVGLYNSFRILSGVLIRLWYWSDITFNKKFLQL